MTVAKIPRDELSLYYKHDQEYQVTKYCGVHYTASLFIKKRFFETTGLRKKKINGILFQSYV